jgi:hypothetical protein
MQLWQYWPPWLREIEEFAKLADAEQPEMDMLSGTVSTAPNHLFLDTVSGASIERWERILGIQRAPGETEEYRRKRIKNVYGAQMPFTMAWLAVQLDQLIGVGLWDVIVENDAFTFYVQTESTNEGFAVELERTVDAFKPANMLFAYITLTYLAITIGVLVANYAVEWPEAGPEICGTIATSDATGIIIQQAVTAEVDGASLEAVFVPCGTEAAGA